MMHFLFGRDRLRLMLGVWLGVYPAVLVLTYAMEPLDWPLYASTFVSTLITIPLITYIVVPLSREAIASVDNKPSEAVEG
jgi:antibiotic biosynthesis monooxygenase (ABM) superfamily enzyme